MTEAGRSGSTTIERSGDAAATGHAESEAMAIPELLAFASHELRAPLTTILASTQLLERTPAADRQELIATIAAEAHRMSAIVDNLLTYARLELGHGSHAEPVLLGRTVEAAVARVRADHPDARIRVEALPGLTVDVDPEDVELVLGNYLSNAHKYGGGRDVDVEVRREGQAGVVLVLDRGPGISDQERPGLFEPFHRLPGTAGRDGLGIGLALCRRVVEGYGGQVWTRPRQGGGTIFGFSLPLVEPEYL